MKILPQNYQLHFEPDLKTATFTGHETMHFSNTETVRDIMLDSEGLEIVSCKLFSSNKKTIDLTFSTQGQQLVITLAKEIKKGEYFLAIDFRGTINDFLAGWYKSRYITNGVQKYVATTHFEAADAKRVFPCIDHPSYKATFDISFTIDQHLQAVSNTLPIKEKMQKNGKKVITFAQTPKMSTYLVYLGVGEFEYAEEKQGNVLIRIVTTPGKKEFTTFALDCTKKFLTFFEEYFQHAYPLNTLDHVAVSDFAAGAMENWGAITFRENLLLYYPNKTSKVAQQSIAEVIAHELAHQWFGNLVTMKWWDDLWLNESFATFMAYKAVDHFWPEWDVWTHYVMSTVFRGMKLDSLQSTHPIQVHVTNVSEITELFDEIAYEKGGSILRMLEEYVGKDSFRDGLREYVSTFQYKNAEGSDLWTSLEHVSKKPVTAIMQSFVQQPGFPVVNVTITKNKMKFSQQRFSLRSQTIPQQVWTIPLVMKDESNTYRHVLQDRLMNVTLPHKPLYVTINPDYAGFYISNYEEKIFQTIGEHLDNLNHSEKLGIIHDFYYLVLSGEKKLQELLDFIASSYKDEQSPTVLIYILEVLVSIYLILLSNDLLQSLIQTFASRALQITGYNPVGNENPDVVMLRNLSLYALSLFDHPKTLLFGEEKFEQFLIDETSLHPDLRGTVYSLAVWKNDKNYQEILKLYKQSHIQEEKVKFLQALARSKNKILLEETLAYALSDEVQYANILYIFAGASRNPHARELTIDWFLTNWDRLIENGGGMSDMMLRHIIKIIIPTMAVEREQEIKEFIKNNNHTSLTKTFEQALEELELNSAFIKKHDANK